MYKISFVVLEELNINNFCNLIDIRYLYFKYSMRSEIIYNN